MSQLLASQSKIKRNKVELRIDQKFQIIEYWQKHPSIKQTEMIKYFNKLFSVNIPATTMSGILSVTSRNKILKQDNVEALGKAFIKLRLIRLTVEINPYLVFVHLNDYGLTSVDFKTISQYQITF
jgi:hypothetical protein